MGRQLRLMFIASTVLFSYGSFASAADYFLTLAGGYAPEGNQASLEANVLFLQQVLKEKQLHHRPHQLYFADGFDDLADLQCVDDTVTEQSAAMVALRDIFRIGARPVYYRNHRVPNISGGLRPDEVRRGLDALKHQLKPGDRLIIYVTAHGSAARDKNSQNTSIACWGNKPLTMKEFATWLDAVPPDVTCISIMAQCYCGGFADMIYTQGDPQQGFSQQLRVGFFAQRYDLPAAGCRPETENDEEYSSYFWGALVGRSRTGKPTSNVDCDQNQRISLAESHAYAVLASETIDIPLRTSDAMLRRYSRLKDVHSQTTRSGTGDEDSEGDLDGTLSAKEINEAGVDPLLGFTGTIYEVAGRGRPEETRAIIGLAEKLGLAISTPLEEVAETYKKLREGRSSMRGPPNRRGRGPSYRRQMQEAVIAKWPELEEPDDWAESELLATGMDLVFLEQLKALPEYAAYRRGTDERRKARDESFAKELQEVKYRRLIHQLETVLLAQNLPLVAEPSIIRRYHAMVSAESDYLDASPRPELPPGSPSN